MENKKTTINGVDIIEDGDVTHFVISDDEKAKDELNRKQELEEKAKKPSSFLGRLLSWFVKSPVKPYVRLSNPHAANPLNKTFDDMAPEMATGIEIGIKGTF